MRQLSALDAQFLNFETATNVANVGGLAILDGLLTREHVLTQLQERLGGIPQLRQRLAHVPLGLDHPYWVEDEPVELDYHVRELALPRPGDDAQLGEQVARLHERPLDRSRPLWEMYVIHGLEGGHTAVYTKMHHAAVDGVAGAEVLSAIMDTTPASRVGEPEPAPDLRRMLLRSGLHAAALPAHLFRFLSEAIPVLDQLPLVSQIPGAGALSRSLRRGPMPELPRVVAPHTPLNGPVSAHRRYAFAELPLAEVKRIKNAFGVTVNDVVMALTAGAVRRWLLAHDALPEGPLVVGVPFSLRDLEGERPGNQVSLMTTSLDTQIGDARLRLGAVHKGMLLIKDRFALSSAHWLRELSESLPAALNGLADRAAFTLVGQSMTAINLIVSNIPGPQLPLSIAGVKLLAHYPVSVVTDVSGGLNVTVFSYDGHLDVGITACRELVPDVWTFPGYLREALAELAP